MTQPDDEFGSFQAGGEFIKPQQLDGHLLIVYPTGYVPHIQTVHTRPDKKSDAIRVDVVDLDAADDAGVPGKVYRNSNWMQAVLIASLTPEIGRKVLGTMAKGVGKPGFNAPWVLNDMSADPNARTRARAWLDANPGFTPSRFVDRASDPMDRGYTPTPVPQPAQYTTVPTAPANVPVAAQVQNYIPVPGSQHQVSEEEMSLLAQLRARRAAQDAQGADTPPPF